MTAQAWLILGLGAAVYALRLSGLLLPTLSLRPSVGRAFRFLPIALLAALVSTGLSTQVAAEPTRLVAAAGAAAIAWRTRQMWACILGGLAIYGVLRLLAPGAV